MALKAWYKVVTPREDLREGKPLDASEFAVHLDHVREGRAPADYQNPKRFFERTYLTKNGSTANDWVGVRQILTIAGITNVPKAAIAVFVGTEFDSISGRGGQGGTPLRKTHWGEIAYQLGGDSGFAIVAEHDKRGEAPGGEVIRQFLPKDK